MYKKPHRRLGDTVPAMLEKGEAVLPVELTAKLADILNTRVYVEPTHKFHKLKLAKGGVVSMPFDTYLKEHQRLIGVLQSGKGLKKEAQDQIEELKKEKIRRVMEEFKAGTLKSSSGDKVTNRKQAIAIALSESKII